MNKRGRADEKNGIFADARFVRICRLRVAETVYDRGELYDVMNVYAKPDLLSEHLMTYFSGTPVDVMENVAGQEDEIYAHVRVAGQIEGYAQIWDGYGHETVLFSDRKSVV